MRDANFNGVLPVLKVLFVCLGNICRSPAAEGVFKSLVKSRGLSQKIQVDSAGTSSYHEGEPADTRMREHAQKRGYRLESLARGFVQKDFDNYDFIVVMDHHNHRDITAQARNDKERGKVSLMTDYLDRGNNSYVPDPYHQDAEGFERVLDIVENASVGLLNKIEKML